MELTVGCQNYWQKEGYFTRLLTRVFLLNDLPSQLLIRTPMSNTPSLLQLGEIQPLLLFLQILN